MWLALVTWSVMADFFQKTLLKIAMWFMMYSSGCKESYIGETGRLFGIRLKEHQKDIKKLADKKYIRATRKATTSEQHKSAITDHVAEANYIIYWEKAKILDRDANSFSERICESTEINHDDGNYTLDHVYSSLLKTTLQPGKETTIINSRFLVKNCDQSTCEAQRHTHWFHIEGALKIFSKFEFIASFCSSPLYVHFPKGIRLKSFPYEMRAILCTKSHWRDLII